MPIKDNAQTKALTEFVKYWTNKGDEKQDMQNFWRGLVRILAKIDDPEKYLQFEKPVIIDNSQKYIDCYIGATKVLIEQKSLGVDLSEKKKQSDGQMLSPFGQALRYNSVLPYDERAKYIITSNFAEFWLYDLTRFSPEKDVIKINLAELVKESYRLEFIANPADELRKKQEKISLQAGGYVRKIYKALAKEYQDPESDTAQKSLNVLCVRLIFCLYAEDAGVFDSRTQFGDFIKEIPPKYLRPAIIELFKILDTPLNERDKYLEENLRKFPYVNGGLFAKEDIEIPQFTQEIKEALLEASEYDWAEINPTIFGAVFESTLNPETRRSGGMHYTSVENIHKVIDPLFLDGLKLEYKNIVNDEGLTKKERISRLSAIQEKMANLKFLDPAAGSGNFLTESYISLRKLENKIIDQLNKNQQVFDFGEEYNPIKVKINQFYGIEINDFAVSVARTALWIAEAQMIEETQKIIDREIDFLPLTDYANIVEGNALKIDWKTAFNEEGNETPLQINYIMGNPPFVGYSLQSKAQKADMLSVYVDEKGKPYKTAGKIDYVAGWYYKAAQFMQNTAIRAAFVSTNSITQGEQVAAVWQPLYDRFNIHIDFAQRTFKWNSESDEKAAVHCVIIGFSSAAYDAPKKIFSGENIEIAANINPYLIDGENVFIESRKKALCDVPEIANGFKAADNGYLILNQSEYDEFLKKEPSAQIWIRPYSMGVEFIHNIARYCLWLVGISPRELNSMPQVKSRVEKCRQWRCAATKTGDAYKLRDAPHLFRPCKQFKDGTYLAAPLVSSENRRYIPMAFVENGMIPGNNLFAIFNISLYHFGVLTSNVHNAWIRTVGGRLKSDYRYSKDIVYNNFPWPSPTDGQKATIEKTAQAILDARALYPYSSLADLYDETTMPIELRKAHQANDRAVMQAYGFDIKTMNEEKCVAELMKLYQQLTN